MENTLLFIDDYNKHAKVEELEKVKAEITSNRDEWIKGKDAEWYAFDKCVCIIENHISKLKGE